MKWGRKKPLSSSPSTCSSSSSRPSLISNVLPSSWLSKFKRVSINSGQSSSKYKPKGQWDSVYMSPWRCPIEDGGGDGSYGGEEDAFWRLSFREETVGGKNSNGSVVRPVWYHNYVENEPKSTKTSSCQACLSLREEEEEEGLVPKFSDMVSELREARGFPREVESSHAGEKVVEIRAPRLRLDRSKKKKSKIQGGKVAKQQLEVEGKLDVENVFKMEAGGDTSGNWNTKREVWNLAHLDGREVMDTYVSDFEEESEEVAQKGRDGLCEGKIPTGWRMLKEMKMEEKRQRKSLYISREEAEGKRPKHKAIKVKSYSPRLASKAEICKIKALEDMKKAKVKTRKKKENRKDVFMGLESFALVKTSLDPHKDFHDSMMEMINVRGISRPEEFEELLACYLTLNSDEYHDLIIKVFRQVWFERTEPSLS